MDLDYGNHEPSCWQWMKIYDVCLDGHLDHRFLNAKGSSFIVVGSVKQYTSSTVKFFQMCSKCKELHDGCQKAILITAEKKTTDDSTLIEFPKRSSQLTSVSIMSERCAPNLVYRRRKQRGNSVPILSVDSPAKRKKSDSQSAVSSEAPLVAATEQHIDSQVQHESVTVLTPIVPLICSKEPDVLRSESIHICSIREVHGTNKAPKNALQKIVHVDSANDSCSSSKSNMKLISATEKTEMDDVGECSSSSIIAVIGKDLSGKDLYFSLLRSQGLLDRIRPVRTCGPSEGRGSSSCSRSCKICSQSETPLKMIICDNCEDAFHMSCYSPRIKTIPIDEWFCHSCSTKKQRFIDGTICRTFPSITSEMGRYRSISSVDESGPIAWMLGDTEPYISDVRVGKGFQAEVPEWSGPIDNDVDRIVEPLELDLSDSCKLERTSGQRSKCISIGNWLQCQEVRDGSGADSGTICGKWRRAPLFEVQTDDWDCFCSVLWDPTHADCAVPQELETDQVLKQLKYIQTLRPRLATKRRSLDQTKSDDALT